MSSRLQNLSLSAMLSLPFVGKPAGLRFALSDRHHPFLVTVTLFGGGGFFALGVSATGVEEIEASIEFGGNVSLNLGVASGGVYVMAGVYFAMSKAKGCELTGYLRCGGYLSVLGLISISIEFYLAFTYRNKGGAGNEIWGQASVTVSVKVVCFSTSVKLSIEKRFAGAGRRSDARRRAGRRRLAGVLPGLRRGAGMTTRQTLQWIAVPGGVLGDLLDGGRLRISVMVTPRLRTDDGNTLAVYPDLLDWPAVLAATTFAVDVDGVGVPAQPLGPTAESDLWQALFPADTPVTPYVFDDYADRPLVTFDVLGVAGQLRSLYAAAAAASPDELPGRRTRRDVEPVVPGLDDLLSAVVRPGQSRFGELSRSLGLIGAADHFLSAARDETARRKSLGARGGDAVQPLPPGTVPEVERAVLFHTSPEPEPREMPADGSYYRATVDFHQMVSALGDHPALMRRLGLLLDLTIDAADLPNPAGFVTVTPTFAPPPDAVLRETVAHATAFRFGDGRFVAARQVPLAAVPEGLVPLAGGAYGTSQLDVDGAALKTLAVATTMTEPPVSPGGSGLHQPDDAGLPALRTGGLSVVHTGRAAALQDEFVGNLDLNAAIEAGPTRLWAEQLVRGYRLDVLDETTGTWRSLHEQVVTATAERYQGGAVSMPGEGVVSMGLAGRVTRPTSSRTRTASCTSTRRW